MKTTVESFVNVAEIEEKLRQNADPDRACVEEIIAKSLDKNRLDPDEVATLLNAEDSELLEMIYEGARELKRRIYGNRIVLFAPLYIGNRCVNDCVYCGFRMSNRKVERRTLTFEELKKEVEALVTRGHKRLILVYGEHPDYDAKFIAKTVETVYSVKVGNGEIRRVNINAAPMDVEDYRIVKEAGIGTFQIFQETYHPGVYKKLHPRGPKSDYLYRLYGLDRAMEAGIDDVGIGALFGLYHWKFEVMGLLYHTMHLEERFGVGPHTISFPRIEPAIATPFSENPPYKVSNEEFKHLVATIRLAVPYTGMILTAREPVEVRREVLPLGVSQIDAGSNIGIGAYSTEDREFYKKSQFLLGDMRPLDEVIGELARDGYIPSFCTACYRLGRTGEHFMEFAIPGFVKEFCTPNAILTFVEYLQDYASDSTREAGWKLVEEQVTRISNPRIKSTLQRYLERVKAGERDLYF
ncbi:MAG: [FeFe] hydrogenase H-cluster radical SAM maturase HydG [Thermotogae bacterium]|nr:[FeFe] hydrogenase H-cluster radical SAM maturase HydG [Thermotogota bacterium]